MRILDEVETKNDEAGNANELQPPAHRCIEHHAEREIRDAREKRSDAHLCSLRAREQCTHSEVQAYGVQRTLH